MFCITLNGEISESFRVEMRFKASGTGAGGPAQRVCSVVAIRKAIGVKSMTYVSLLGVHPMEEDGEDRLQRKFFTNGRMDTFQITQEENRGEWQGSSYPLVLSSSHILAYNLTLKTQTIKLDNSRDIIIMTLNLRRGPETLLCRGR